jgi:hypothetical protein
MKHAQSTAEMLSVSRLRPMPTEEKLVVRRCSVGALVCGIVALVSGGFAWPSYSSYGEWTKLIFLAMFIALGSLTVALTGLLLGWLVKKRILTARDLRSGDWMVGI